MLSSNKEIIRQVNLGFESGDTDAILSFLAEDVQWHVNGKLSATDKESFRKEVNNPAFESVPKINVTKMLEDGDHLAAEGDVECFFKGGKLFHALFFDIYRIENGKIKEMRSYVVEKPQA